MIIGPCRFPVLHISIKTVVLIADTVYHKSSAFLSCVFQETVFHFLVQFIGNIVHFILKVFLRYYKMHKS